MKKFTSIVLVADLALSLVTCGARTHKQEYVTEPVREVVSEHISSRVEEIKEVTDKITKKRICKSTEKSTTEYSNPYAKKCLGTFGITFYVPDAKWGYATATGETPIHLKTCAVDPRIIPYGSTLLVIGQNGRQLVIRANDCGSGIKGQRLDIFWDLSTKEGYDFFGGFGESATVYLLEE